MPLPHAGQGEPLFPVQGRWFAVLQAGSKKRKRKREEEEGGWSRSCALQFLGRHPSQAIQPTASVIRAVLAYWKGHPPRAASHSTPYPKGRDTITHTPPTLI